MSRRTNCSFPQSFSFAENQEALGSIMGFPIRNSSFRMRSTIYIPSALCSVWDENMGLGVQDKLATPALQQIQLFLCTAADHRTNLMLNPTCPRAHVYEHPYPNAVWCCPVAFRLWSPGSPMWAVRHGLTLCRRPACPLAPCSCGCAEGCLFLVSLGTSRNYRKAGLMNAWFFSAAS